ncbi:MAG: helix-turn-helix domain-containing protein [Ktedonobacteraceae bacterium]|nr:helix-turn-helix domain-containing protein [Ktedonobacteraceae bacterium]
MPMTENGETYYTAAEASKFLGVSRDTFYRSVRDRLQAYQLGVLKRTYYKLSDLQALKGVRPVEPEQKDEPEQKED